MKNPIVHILLFGSLLAVLWLVIVGPPAGGVGSKQVIITDSDIEQLASSFMRQWQREPTSEELRGLLESFVRDEVLYREALARDYDVDDGAVRRAMLLKMEFLGQSQADNVDPSEAEIESYFAFRREKYRVPQVLSFVHLFFSADMRGATVSDDARATLPQLEGLGPNQDLVSQYGDPFLLRYNYVAQSEREIRSEFGVGFTEEILQLEPDGWAGPIQSGYGYHLVYVYGRTESYVPEWQAIRSSIERDMLFEAQRAAGELFYTEILRNYQIVFRGEVQNILEEETQR